MIKFECKELGTNCSYVAKGNTLDDVKIDAMQHAKTVHKDLLSNMSTRQLAELDRTITRKSHSP